MNLYPNVKMLFQTPGNAPIMQIHRSLRSIISDLSIFFLSVIAVYILNYYFHGITPPQNIPIIKYLSIRWLSIIPIIFLLGIIRKYHDDLYIFEKQKVTHKSGRLSLEYSVPVVRYADIKAITVSQDLMGRVFDYGNVELGTAAQDGVELSILGIRGPKNLASIIDQLCTYNRKRLPLQMKRNAD